MPDGGMEMVKTKIISLRGYCAATTTTRQRGKEFFACHASSIEN